MKRAPARAAAAMRSPGQGIGFSSRGDARRRARIQQGHGAALVGGGHDGDGTVACAPRSRSAITSWRCIPVLGRGPAIVHHQHQRARRRRLAGRGPAADRPGRGSEAPPPAGAAAAATRASCAGVCSSFFRPSSSRSGGNGDAARLGGVTFSSHHSTGSANSPASIQGAPKLNCGETAQASQDSSPMAACSAISAA